MLRTLARPSRSTAVVTALGVLAAVALHAPARSVAACPASPGAAHARVVEADARSVVRTASGGEVERDGPCSTPQLPPLALVASALALLAVPRCRQGGLTEL